MRLAARNVDILHIQKIMRHGQYTNNHDIRSQHRDRQCQGAGEVGGLKCKDIAILVHSFMTRLLQ